MTDPRDVLIGELGILVRAVVFAAVGYGAWTFASGGSFDPATLGAIAVALFVLANVAFWGVRLYRPAFLDRLRFMMGETPEDQE